MTDPIADMLTRIRNALLAKKAEVVFPYSNMKAGILEILKNHGYISDYSVLEKGKDIKFSELNVVLKYKKPGFPSIINLRRVSVPGRRVYVKKDNIPNVLNNLGIAILSTSQGLMTNKEAKKRKLGGEYICEVY